MKFTAKTAEEVVWTTDQHIACCNLSLTITQHWAYVHKLNGYLMELVRSLSIGYIVANFLLNPLAPEHVPQSMKNNKEGHNMRNIQANTTSSEQWKIPRQYVRKHGRSLSDAVKEYSNNLFDVLGEDVKDDNESEEKSTRAQVQRNKKSNKQKIYDVNEMSIDDLSKEIDTC